MGLIQMTIDLLLALYLEEADLRCHQPCNHIFKGYQCFIDV